MRDRRIVVVIGAPASGKSTLSQRAYVAAIGREGRRWVRALDPGAQFAGGEMPGDPDGWLEQLRPPSRERPSGVRFLLLDDADSYAPTSPRKGSAWADLYLRHRWWDTDVLLTARRPQNLSPTLLSAAEFMFVFRINPGDRSAFARLAETAPGLVPPTEPYKFIRRNLFTGEEVRGETLARGGWRLLR